MLRRIVPALGVIALASPAAMSQEIAKGVFLDGWIDTILTGTDSQYETTGTTSADKQAANNSAAFTTAAKVKIGWNVTDQVSGKIGVKFNNNNADNTDPSKDPVYLQEAFFSANFGQGFNVTAGKAISFIGLQSAEPTGLFRVGVTPSINLYTPDMLGVTVGYSNDQFAAAVIVNNGNFDDSGVNDATSQTRNNVSHNLGYGIDLTYNLPNKLGNVNLEAAYDPASGTGLADTDGDGFWDAIVPNNASVYQIGLNATLKPTDKTTVLAEGIYRATSGGWVDKKDKATTKEDLGWMILANQVVSTEGIPASVSGSFGQYAPGYSSYETTLHTKNEAALAVLTNPFGSSSFGLNAEIAYAWYDGTKSDTALDVADLASVNAKPSDSYIGGTSFSIEGLVVIP